MQDMPIRGRIRETLSWSSSGAAMSPKKSTRAPGWNRPIGHRSSTSTWTITKPRNRDIGIQSSKPGHPENLQTLRSTHGSPSHLMTPKAKSPSTESTSPTHTKPNRAKSSRTTKVPAAITSPSKFITNLTEFSVSN